MTGISEKENNLANNHDFELGIPGFHYSDLYDAVKLRELAEKFYAEVKEKDALLHEALLHYINAKGERYEPRVESKILTDSAPYLSDFIARMFLITRERGELKREITEQDPIWKYKFFVQRRAIKKFKAETIVDFDEKELTEALRELKFTVFDETLIYDDELAISYITNKLVEAEEVLTKELEITAETQETINKIHTAYDKLKDKTFGRVFSRYVTELEGTGDLLQIKAVLHLLEAWSAIQFFGKKKDWYSFKTPHGLDYQNLVHIVRPSEKVHE
ncbi:MAG: hypothetical protein ABIP06_03620, partial [Pyrinomonadaceae bacterium]